MAVQGHTCKAGEGPSTGRRDLSFAVRGSWGTLLGDLPFDLPLDLALSAWCFASTAGSWLKVQSLPNLHVPGPCAKQGLSLEEPRAPDFGEYDLVGSWHSVRKVAVDAFLAIADDQQEFAGDLGCVPRGFALSA